MFSVVQWKLKENASGCIDIASCPAPQRAGVRCPPHQYAGVWPVPLSFRSVKLKLAWLWQCHFIISTAPTTSSSQTGSVTIMVWTPYIMQPWLVRQALLFSFNLLNPATPLLSHAVRLVLLLFVLLSSLPCYTYDAILISTLGYHLFTNTYIS